MGFFKLAIERKTNIDNFFPWTSFARLFKLSYKNKSTSMRAAYRLFSGIFTLVDEGMF